MVRVAGRDEALQSVRSAFVRFAIRCGLVVVAVALFYWGFTARVPPDRFGVVQVRLGSKPGIKDRIYSPGLYIVPPGSTMHYFPRTIHVLEASYDHEDALSRAPSSDARRQVEKYFEHREEVLGVQTHRVVQALNIQTSDGYAAVADVTLLYSIENPVQIAREFGWGSLYVDSFVINTFRNGVLGTLGKMNAESFYNETVRIPALEEAEQTLRERFKNRGFKVERLLLRNYQYAATYEKSLQDKKVAVQVTARNRKQSLVNEERAKLQQIESRGNATINIAESEVEKRMAQIRAEAELYASQTRARADQEYLVAQAEAKRLKADALTHSGGRLVVALEMAKLFDSIQGAVMTPEQYISFVRSAWAVIGVSSGVAGGGGN
jgi:regulator of protease activity HflC (stomatin/prohibitin superfamily)